MFDPIRAHAELVSAITMLQPMRCGLNASSSELENNAAYIEHLCLFVGHHIESVMADASASISVGKIDEELARAIVDLGQDCAAQLNNAASVLEAA